MPYSNQRRHNSPSIPQTPYQILVTPCPNFDPIYQVIFLENSNEWKLSPAKRMILKKEQGLKRKRGETSVQKLHILRREKKKWMRSTSCWERFYWKKERTSQFPIVQNPMCGLIHTHTSFTFALPSIPWLLPFLPPFTTPFSINHDYLPHKLSRIFLCFYNIQGVA
jgi:hypothetical protein